MGRDLIEETTNGDAQAWKSRKAKNKEKEAKKEEMMLALAAEPEVNLSGRPPVPDVLKTARYENITRMILQGMTKPKMLAAAVGMSSQLLRKTLRMPEFIQIFDKASKALMLNVDDVIKDETVALSVRKNALHRRSVTMIGKVLETVDAEIEHAKSLGTPWAVRSTMVKAGIEAATGAIDRDTADLEPRHGGSKHLHLHITQHDAEVLRDTMADVAEEVNISDIFTDGKVVEAEIVETEEDD